MPETTVTSPSVANGVGKAVPVSSSLASEAVLEENYQKIGRCSGPWAKREAQDALRDFWRGLGEPGGAWLARRVSREFHMEVIYAAASHLADLKEAGIPAILAVLQGDTSSEQALCLLSALSHLQDEGVEAAAELPLAALAQYLAHSDFDVREAAVDVIARCRKEQAGTLLIQRKGVEQDEHVLTALDRALSTLKRDGEVR